MVRLSGGAGGPVGLPVSCVRDSPVGGIASGVATGLLSDGVAGLAA